MKYIRVSLITDVGWSGIIMNIRTISYWNCSYVLVALTTLHIWILRARCTVARGYREKYQTVVRSVATTRRHQIAATSVSNTL